MPLPQPVLAGSPHPVTHRTVRLATRTGPLDVHVAEAGEGPPLVLLHGWPQHWWVWRHLVPRLAGSYRLVMPDLRGSGWTGAPARGYDKEQLADDLLGVVEALGLRRPGLVGHDWGGWTGFLACLRAPGAFRGFVPLGITHPFQTPDARVLQAWRATYQVVLGTPGLGEALLRASPLPVEGVIRLGTTRSEAFTPEDLRVFARVLQEPARARASSRLYRTFVLGEAGPVFRGRYAGQRLHVPTRLLVGADDPVVTQALLPGWEGAADDMAVRVLPGCGHFVPEEEPDVVAETVRELVPA